MTSRLVVDTIQASTLGGNMVTIPTGQKLYAPGHVIQTVQTVKTDTWSATPGAGNYAAVTGLTASLNPSSVNSKILVTVNMFVGYDSYMFKGLLKRNGVVVVQGGSDAGSRPRVSFAGSTYSGTQTNDRLQLIPTTITYLDSPGTVSTCTYTVELGCYSTYMIFLNRSYSWQTSAGDYDGTPPSMITLQEIGG